MKNVKSFSMVLFAVLISFVSMAASAPNSLEQEKKLLRNEITVLVHDMDIDESETVANIEFIVNDRNRIEITQIDCVDGELCQEIKNRLNNSKVRTKLSHKAGTYHVTFRFRLE